MAGILGAETVGKMEKEALGLRENGGFHSSSWLIIIVGVYYAEVILFGCVQESDAHRPVVLTSTSGEMKSVEHLDHQILPNTPRIRSLFFKLQDLPIPNWDVTQRMLRHLELRDEL